MAQRSPTSASRRGDANPTGTLGLNTVTLDGNLLGTAPAGRSLRACGGAAAAYNRPVQSPRSAGLPRPSVKTKEIYLDKGDAEDAFLSSLRTHFVRNSTADPSFPLSKAARVHGNAAGMGPIFGGLGERERFLWEQRERELLDAQEARFAQLEDTLRAREEKREAYIVHRLEATAAEKVDLLARQREGLSRQAAVLAEQGRHARIEPKAAVAGVRLKLPALPTAALKPLPPASPKFAAIVGEARANLTSYSQLTNLESGLQLKETLGCSGTSMGLSPGRARSAQQGGGARTSRWAAKQQETYHRQLDSVYDGLQQAKATGARSPHPLEPAHVKRILSKAQWQDSDEEKEVEIEEAFAAHQIASRPWSRVSAPSQGAGSAGASRPESKMEGTAKPGLQDHANSANGRQGGVACSLPPIGPAGNGAWHASTVLEAAVASEIASIGSSTSRLDLGQMQAKLEEAAGGCLLGMASEALRDMLGAAGASASEVASSGSTTSRLDLGQMQDRLEETAGGCLLGLASEALRDMLGAQQNSVGEAEAAAELGSAAHDDRVVGEVATLPAAAAEEEEARMEQAGGMQALKLVGASEPLPEQENVSFVAMPRLANGAASAAELVNELLAQMGAAGMGPFAGGNEPAVEGPAAGAAMCECLGEMAEHGSAAESGEVVISEATVSEAELAAALQSVALAELASITGIGSL